MKTRLFRITIAASRAAVWHVLLDDAMFRQWVPSLAEGSCADGDWGEGGVIRFLTAGGDGSLSVIGENRPHERLSIKPIGVVNEGIADTDSDAPKHSVPSYDKSALNQIGGGTELLVNMKLPSDTEDIFSDTWPRPLEAIKRLAETAAG